MFPQTYKPRWELPPGTTHVSVECTIDKGLVQTQTEIESKTRRKEFKELLRQDMQTKLLNWGMVVLASCIIIIALSKLVVMPLVNVEIARRKNNDRRRRQRRMSRSSSYRHHSGSITTATRRISSTSGSGGSSDNHPMHHLPQEHLTLIAHAEGMEGIGSPCVEGYRRNEPNYDDDDCRSSAGDSNSYSDDLSHGTTASEDFDAQVPADFDAIPIVAATIMPVVTLQATVVQDGITYT